MYQRELEKPLGKYKRWEEEVWNRMPDAQKRRLAKTLWEIIQVNIPPDLSGDVYEYPGFEDIECCDPYGEGKLQKIFGYLDDVIQKAPYFEGSTSSSSFENLDASEKDLRDTKKDLGLKEG